MKRRDFLRTLGSDTLELTRCSRRAQGPPVKADKSLTTASALSSESGHAKPNFVLIVADDLGYGDVGCYGHQSNETPHLDKMAAEGVRFIDFHSNGPMCLPTRAALLTGQYQNRFGRALESALSAKAHAKMGLPLGAVTIPEALKQV